MPRYLHICIFYAKKLPEDFWKTTWRKWKNSPKFFSRRRGKESASPNLVLFYTWNPSDYTDLNFCKTLYINNINLQTCWDSFFWDTAVTGAEKFNSQRAFSRQKLQSESRHLAEIWSTIGRPSTTCRHSSACFRLLEWFSLISLYRRVSNLNVAWLLSYQIFWDT